MLSSVRRSGVPYDPTLHAPPRYRRACEYDAFVPDPLADLDVQIGGELAALISEAESEIAELNRSGAAALVPLARLLLRTESIASSRVEGMQADARSSHERRSPMTRAARWDPTRPRSSPIST
jgi:hypothetical protein